ncbi:MAG: SGNH/GDSL hydrolase family protein [Muribaculaceae bacterium]|nr:SGNH/GDSL hydrolase family protein [Roseburia sp.]MCM1430160.1 SGNH/GDSL hydrolase family protein [Muribaculaceae bacterium]MCM1493091.1 SGNH/GDSL hydrolase family protein [Muribaculaceae bacterium]
MEENISLPLEALERGMSNRGDWSRIQSVMRRAKEGEALVIGFIGGSITQGSLASEPGLCYAARVFQWWAQTFPKSSFTYVNAGIGGTTSQFGAARVKEDLLRHRPDFVIVEFSVNDESTEHFKETYEGLVRQIYGAENKPALLLVHNMYYDSGKTAQLVHGQIGRHYDVPCVSMPYSIYPEVLSGRILPRELTEDNLHPNDRGHGLIASVICHALEQIRADTAGQREDTKEPESAALPEALTENRYQNTVRFRNADAEPELRGFVADLREQNGITDVFKRGWTAGEEGASFALKLCGRCIAVQYRKSPACHAPAALVEVDGRSVCVLDGNFPGGWGDSLELETVYESMEAAEHTVTVTIESGEAVTKDFYLASVQAAL